MKCRISHILLAFLCSASLCSASVFNSQRSYCVDSYWSSRNKMSFFDILTIQSNLYGYTGQLAYYVDGYWSSWNSMGYFDKLTIQQNNISLYYCDAHPSEYKWKFSFPTYKGTDGEWTVYEGTFEYYITDEFPDLKSIFLSSKREEDKWPDPRYHNTSKGQTPCVKKTEKVIIKRLKKELTKTVLDKEYIWGKKKYKTYTYGYLYAYNIFFNNSLALGFSYEDHF